MKRWVICILYLLIPSVCFCAVEATLPQATVDTTYSLPVGGTTWNCSTAAQFTAALASSNLGDVIVLTAGNTYQASGTSGFQLPNKTSGSGWIYIISSDLASLPAGTRVGPSDASHMPKLQMTYGTSDSVVTTAVSAHHYRFVGIEFTTTNFAYEVVSIGAGSTVATTPHHIIFDRCYIHGHATLGSRRTIKLNAGNAAVVDSYMKDAFEEGADTQGIWVNQSPGPLKIYNNHIEAAGENVMFGGSDNDSADLIPQDVTIQRNYLYKPISWMGGPWIIKNLLESKMSKRVLVEGNIFENHWDGGTSQYYMIILKSGNQNLTNPWAVTRDWTIRYNKVINVESFMGAADCDDNCGDEQAHLTTVRHNLVFLRNNATYARALFDYIQGDVIFENNTILNVQNMMIVLALYDSGFSFRNNILNFGYYGLMCANGEGEGTTCLNKAYPGPTWVFDYNAIVGLGYEPANYPPGNFWPIAWANVRFVNYTGDSTGNYRLASDSIYNNAGSDGKDLGCDIDAMEAAIAGAPVVEGCKVQGISASKINSITTSKVNAQ